MTSPPLLRRKAARLDIEAAADHYLALAGEGIAADFLNAVEAALDVVATYPDAGSPRYA